MHQYVLYLISTIIIILSFPISNLVSNLIVRREIQKDNVNKRKNKLLNYFSFALRMIIMIIFIFIAFKISNINTVVLLGTFGILSLIVPLTLQIPIQDFACGIFIQLFDKYRVGDYVSTDKVEGIIKNIKGFNTEIESIVGTEEIPNSLMWRSNLNNYFRDKQPTLHMQFVVSNQNNMKYVEHVILNFIKDYRNVIQNSIRILILPTNDTNSVGQTLEVVLKTKRMNYIQIRQKLPMELVIEMQKNGVIFIDGHKPVSIDYRTNTITPIILDYDSQFHK
tara:strand:- start:3567 stop:4403 length:837 start_codon:yes stop_codon:yes gene_type:complete